MANTPDTTAPSGRLADALPDLPIVVWMVLITLALGLIGGLDANALIATYNAGFGSALGEFALILLPSFVLAAALSHADIASPGMGRITATLSPVAGAGMICPDTAYAALSPAAGNSRLDVAFGAYAGFKLLYPAGPLLVATGLGVLGQDGVGTELALYGVALLLPVWAMGLLWARLALRQPARQPNPTAAQAALSDTLRPFAPFALLASLLCLGALLGTTSSGAINFLLQPKGALLAAALLALAQTAAQQRRGCWDSAVRRTGSLLLLIGAASAFGAVLTALIPIEDFIPQGSGLLTLVGLFALTAAFKLIQGSSMATFAAVAPVAAPIVLAADVPAVAAIYAICLGSFIAVLPNDSYYWLVRRDALEDDPENAGRIWILSSGVTVQTLFGLILVLGATLLWGP